MDPAVAIFFSWVSILQRYCTTSMIGLLNMTRALLFWASPLLPWVSPSMTHRLALVLTLNSPQDSGRRSRVHIPTVTATSHIIPEHASQVGRAHRRRKQEDGGTISEASLFLEETNVPRSFGGFCLAASPGSSSPSLSSPSSPHSRLCAGLQAGTTPWLSSAPAAAALGC